MGVLDKILEVGGDLVGVVFPQAKGMIDMVKKYTSDDAFGGKSDDEITGTELYDAIKALPSDTQLAIVESNNAVLMTEINAHKELQVVMANRETPTPSQRGRIAMMLTITAISITGLSVAAILIIAFVNKTFPDPLLIASLLGLPYTIVATYMGVKSSEIKRMHDNNSPLTGTPKTSIFSSLTNLVSGVKK